MACHNPRPCSPRRDAAGQAPRARKEREPHMAASSASLHENPEALTPELIDRHRAIVSLMEEFEAVDWYDQRAHACSDPELRAILEHNRDEEKEHAMMVLEWLRRSDAALDGHIQDYLNQPGAIVDREKQAETATGEGGATKIPLLFQPGG